MVLWVVQNKDCEAYEKTFDDYKLGILKEIEEYGNPHTNRES